MHGWVGTRVRSEGSGWVGTRVRGYTRAQKGGGGYTGAQKGVGGYMGLRGWVHVGGYMPRRWVGLDRVGLGS
eukprot:gene15884-biopygen18749